MPTLGSLFSGIGGLDLGLERAGFEVRWQVEIDPYCRRVLERHWPNVQRYADVAALAGEELERVDCIAGGFPCQPVSLAGRGLAQQDSRWLWPEFDRIIRAVGPRLVIVENVPGLLGRGLGIVLGDLADLGFDAEWSCVSACSLGAPHMRKRLFVVAHAMRFGRQEAHDHLELPPIGRGDWWSSEPAVGRVADGSADWVARMKGLGNAVVPQVAEVVGQVALRGWSP